MTIKSVSPSELNAELASELKNIPEIKPPEWAPFVKTGASKERPPVDRDWWYKRVASFLRKVYILGPIGVSKLRTQYGGRKNTGSKPERVWKGSGSIVRKGLQQLGKAGLIKYVDNGVRKGQVITPKGMSLLEKTAQKIKKLKS